MSFFENPDKRRAGRLLGIIVALAGCVIVALGFNSTLWETLGLIICMIGVFCVNSCRAKGLEKERIDRPHGQCAGFAQRPGALAWWLGAASVLALIGSFVALYVDAAFGSHWTWPLYAVVASALACAVSWGYLAAKMGWFI